MADVELMIIGPIRLLWRDGSTAAVIDTPDDLKNLNFGVTFVPAVVELNGQYDIERDKDGRPIFREYLETIH